MSDLIKVNQLTHRYPHSDKAALDGVTLSIPRGCSFGLLGPNGAGKTTLLSILTGLQTPQTGSVTIDGKDIATHAADIKAISAYVPQEYAFYLNLSGRENLHFFADVYGLTHSRWLQQLDYCVQVCRLQELLDKRVVQYSGGMKRRLNLAIGLLNAPQILYLDEPTVGIDAQSRQVLIEAIQALRSNGTTVIYTSHYMEEVEALCDELAIINHGRVIARDTTVGLLQQGPHKTLLIKFAHAPSEKSLQALQPWQPQLLQARQYELDLQGADEVAAVLQRCAAEHLPIEQMQFGVSKLERIYMSLLQAEAAQDIQA